MLFLWKSVSIWNNKQFIYKKRCGKTICDRTSWKSCIAQCANGTLLPNVLMVHCCLMCWWHVKNKRRRFVCPEIAIPPKFRTVFRFVCKVGKHFCKAYRVETLQMQWHVSKAYEVQVPDVDRRLKTQTPQCPLPCIVCNKWETSKFKIPFCLNPLMMTHLDISIAWYNYLIL